jgi:ribosomal protein S18 acetylase RimI-like enzyme
MARYHGQPVGCGAVKLPPGQPAHLKRMWVAPTARGLGIAGLLLTELERIAADSGAAIVRLDTNSALATATNLYRARGYVEVSDFNGEPHADLWFERAL